MNGYRTIISFEWKHFPKAHDLQSWTVMVWFYHRQACMMVQYTVECLFCPTVLHILHCTHCTYPSRVGLSCTHLKTACMTCMDFRSKDFQFDIQWCTKLPYYCNLSQTCTPLVCQGLKKLTVVDALQDKHSSPHAHFWFLRDRKIQGSVVQKELAVFTITKYSWLFVS